MEQPTTYSIGEASQILNKSISTLRRWDKEGKLKAHRGSRNRRYYDARDIEKLKKQLDISDTDELTDSEAKAFIPQIQVSLFQRLEDYVGHYKTKHSLINFGELVYALILIKTLEETKEPSDPDYHEGRDNPVYIWIRWCAPVLVNKFYFKDLFGDINSIKTLIARLKYGQKLLENFKPKTIWEKRIFEDAQTGFDVQIVQAMLPMNVRALNNMFKTLELS